MPVRARAVGRLAIDAVGHQWFDNSRGFECKSMPTAAYNETSDAADVLYERIVDSIDWSRILIEAVSRHFDLVRLGSHSQGANDIVEDVCGSCLQEALLADEHMPRHSPVPLPRNDRGQDWLGILSEMREKYGRKS
jgi:hypothetical protein